MYIPALLNLAKELTGQNQHDEAKKHFQKILEIEPNHAGALAAIGQ
jgi:tetratricopeptide (TPR) repeat protein